MIIKKSSALWDHVPTLQELRELTDPDKDPHVASFPDGVDISLYIDYTGLKMYSNGRSERTGSATIKSEMKYIIEDDGEVIYPDYDIPKKGDFILI